VYDVVVTKKGDVRVGLSYLLMSFLFLQRGGVNILKFGLILHIILQAPVVSKLSNTLQI